MFTARTRMLSRGVLRDFVASNLLACTLEHSVMHERAREVIKRTMKRNDRADGHCYSFASILRSWMFGEPKFFFPETSFVYNYLHLVQK